MASRKFPQRVLALAAALLLLPAGCAKNEPIQQRPSSPVTLTLMLPQTHYKDFFRQLLATFEAENPDIRIEPQIIPDNQWTDLVKAKVAVGETPDLIRIDKGLLENVGTEHFVEFDAGQPWYDRVLPDQRVNKEVGGRLYGLPVSSSTCLGVVYNRSIFTRYGLEIPKTFEQFQVLCRTLRANGLIPLYASDKDSWTVQLGFNSVASQTMDAGTWENLKEGRVKWAEVPEFVEILDAMTSLRTDGYTNSDYLDATYTSATSAMAEERAAMYIAGGEFCISDIQILNPAIDLMIFPLPYRRDILTVIDGPGQFSLFRESPNREEAERFLNWFSQPEHMDVFTNGWGHMPVFSDQVQPDTEYHQTLVDAYISQGKTVLEINDVLSGADLGDFWGYQQEMLAGTLDARQVLEKWDESFARQMRQRVASGWD